MRGEKIVGIGEIEFSDMETEILATYSLSSCVAVTAYCPIKKVAGMVHLFLPTPAESRIESKPSKFASTGVHYLVNTMIEKYKCLKSTLVIGIYGGASSGASKQLQIGERNIEQAEKALSFLNLKTYQKEIGGTVSRSLRMSVKNGTVELRTLPLLSNKR